MIRTSAVLVPLSTRTALGVEVGVEVATVGGDSEELEFPVLIQRVAKRVAGLKRERGSGRKKGGIVLARSSQRDLDRADVDLCAGIDDIARDERITVRFERRLDVGLIVAERLEGDLDVVHGAHVQADRFAGAS
jgi:hypothetical protein